jgi:hypothetical protein
MAFSRAIGFLQKNSEDYGGFREGFRGLRYQWINGLMDQWINGSMD